MDTKYKMFGFEIVQKAYSKIFHCTAKKTRALWMCSNLHQLFVFSWIIS